MEEAHFSAYSIHPSSTKMYILYVEIQIWDQNNFAGVTAEEKKNPFKGSIQAKLFTSTQFLREVTF